MVDFSQPLHCALCEVYPTVFECNVWLWNRIKIADYFPALMLPEA